MVKMIRNYVKMVGCWDKFKNKEYEMLIKNNVN